MRIQISFEKYSAEIAHIPSPLPDRVVLTWNDDPASTQAVNWRTDTSVKVGLAQLAIANSNGRALNPNEFKAETTYFKSDINEAHYHSVTFKNLQPRYSICLQSWRRCKLDRVLSFQNC